MRLAKQCGGRVAAFLTGDAKETADLWDCLKTGKTASCKEYFACTRSRTSRICCTQNQVQGPHRFAKLPHLIG
jgi:hypothetical protein